MNVYLIIEEMEQEEFTDEVGYKAAPLTTVMGVYENRERAEKEKEKLDEQAKIDVEKFNCDLASYFIEERPVL